jgi:hypothetical protein
LQLISQRVGLGPYDRRMKYPSIAATAAGLLLTASGVALSQDHPNIQQGNYQQPIYKCAAGDSVTYSHVPCPGAKAVGVESKTATRYATPPQDRAKLMRRAELTASVREECENLDAAITREQASLKAKGPAVTITDEQPLVKSKLRARELRC